MFKRQYSRQQIFFEDFFPYKVGRQDPFDYMADRTLMRPRDLIAFVNECLEASDGLHEVSASRLQRAEVEFSRKRRDALEQEWQSAFPSIDRLLAFAASRKKVSIEFRELLDNGLDELALEIAARGKIGFDPIFDAAQRSVEKKETDTLAFLAEVAALLYRVGAVGLKLDPAERFLYSHIDEPLISIERLTPNTRLRIHPMLHGAFRLQSDR